MEKVKTSKRDLIADFADQKIVVDDNGVLTNRTELVAAIVSEFGCVERTAYRHVNAALERHNNPDAALPQWGGVRDGAGRKSTA